ncbi:MAG TPA: hypothetical protein VNY05_45460 [Candidatus Acidoferrales bacterium]|jgi:hypothetical protein|nr:hypothetical protein [Candidatus Acidoferrales bacterium]
MKKVLTRNAAILAATVILTGVTVTPSHAAGLQAELRSSAALVPAGTPGAVAPTAPAGGVVTGTQAWACDARQGFAPVIAIETGVVDPLLAIGTAGALKLPVSPTTVPATCGQTALGTNGAVYITQAVVDTSVTPSTNRGVLRTALDPATGALIGPSTYIATTAGLDGNQPTAAAIGPDGNLYVGFLKNGNVKRILSPGVGSTQVMQSVGNTPQGHPARAFAFVGNDLFIASVDSLSVILNATSAACTGGCNATALSDGFSGVAHTGLAFDGNRGLYFTVAGNPLIPGSSQVWRLSLSTSQALYTFVAQGGADRNGANASNFSFNAGKTNLLMLDAGGNLWIGDDASDAAAAGAGRLWTVPAGSLAALTGGNTTAGTNVQAIFNLLRGPWFVSLSTPQVTTQFVPTFNADGSFTATLTPTSPAGPVTTDAGTWLLTPPNVVQPFGNAQAHLMFTDTQGVVLFSNDILLLNVDTFTSETTGTGTLGAPFEGTWIKFTP